MSVNNARKIGFVSALSICFTSIVGIGIFLKNSSVGKNVGGNGISWLMTWIISGIIAMLLAYHFGRISRIESKKSLTGLSGWADELSDEKNNWFRKIVTTNYGHFYNPILTICLSFFCAEFFISFIQTINPNVKLDVWVHALIAICLLTFFVLNNYFSVRFSGYISISTSFLKFIPLLMVIIIGLIFANSHHEASSGTTNGFNVNISFDKAIQGIMLSIPSVLFAFDSFIGVGAWSKHIKGGGKAVSKVIVVAMILVAVIYCLICLSSIFHFNPENGTTILNVLIDSLPSSAKTGMTIFISLFIFISAFGTTNSVCGTMLNEFKNLVLLKQTLLTYWAVRFGQKRAPIIVSAILLLFWCLVLFIPSIIINSDAIIDGFSNLVVVFNFLIYAYTIFLYWKNVESKQNKNIKYSVIVWVSIISVLLVVCLNVFYVFYDGISQYQVNSNWGLFLVGNGFGTMKNLDVLIFYLSFTIVFVSFPFISSYLAKRFLTNKKQ